MRYTLHGIKTVFFSAEVSDFTSVEYVLADSVCINRAD